MAKIRNDMKAGDLEQYQGTPKKKVATRNPKPKAITKLQLIGDVLDSNDTNKIELSVEDFKRLFSYNQLNRGWTKPQIEFLLENINVSK
jgi:hypothetical protein|tara:strand:- start:1222 stop:1488 length:267 start_codon:yes stop_codon:yes gene_type:complete